MNLKSLNRNKILRQILPSVFFIICIALYVGEVRGLTVNLIAGCFTLLFLGNMFFQNIVISRILGVIFLLGSFYLTLAMLSDVANRKATLGYLGMGFLVSFSIVMSVLLILGSDKKNKLAETKQ